MKCTRLHASRAIQFFRDFILFAAFMVLSLLLLLMVFTTDLKWRIKFPTNSRQKLKIKAETRRQKLELETCSYAERHSVLIKTLKFDRNF